MAHGLVVYRRDLPGGHVVMISIDDRDAAAVVGRLQIERRTDPARRRAGEPPVVAEVRGESRDAVLQALRTVAANDAELRQRLEAWVAARQALGASAPRKVAMPDGAFWTVERRHEMAQLRRRGSEVERRLFLFFRSPQGGFRRAEVPVDFAAEPDDPELRERWARAEVLR